MDMHLLVQTRDKLDAVKAVEFIDSCKEGKLALIHASLKDEVALLDFFQNLVENLKTPFAGTRVGGSATQEGYFEDAVAIAVLCGDFDVNVFHEKINFDDLRETVEKITPKFKDWSTTVIYASVTYKQNVDVDFIFRRINNMYPNLQILGGASAPPSFVATNEGIYENQLLCANLRIKTEFEVITGFIAKNEETFVVTKADEQQIYDLDNKNAVETYSRIQHIRPYFHNMLMKYFLTRADLPHMIKELFKANAIIKESGIRSQMQGLGCTLKGSMLDLLIVTELDERKGVLLTQNYRPNGTILKRADTTKEKQMAVYDAINKKFEESKAVLIIACAALPYWFDYDYAELGAKAKKYRIPVLISFFFGEYGTTLPYSGLNQNVVHGGVVKALAFK